METWAGQWCFLAWLQLSPLPSIRSVAHAFKRKRDLCEKSWVEIRAVLLLHSLPPSFNAFQMRMERRVLLCSGTLSRIERCVPFNRVTTKEESLSLLTQVYSIYCCRMTRKKEALLFSFSYSSGDKLILRALSCYSTKEGEIYHTNESPAILNIRILDYFESSNHSRVSSYVTGLL